MTGILWLLIWGLLFYVMMRWGCGAHMMHGGHTVNSGHGGTEQGGHIGHSSTPTGADPVCGMEVNAGTGYSRAYADREYRFCSRRCLDEFDADPDRYSG